MRVVTSERGSRFSLCEAAKRDARLAKYPRLPVLTCPAYEPEEKGAATLKPRREP